MPERNSEYARASNDWYVEPAWVLKPLIDVCTISEFHDPCCGSGTLPIEGKRLGLKTTGADLIQRNSAFPVQDYLKDIARHTNIVTNPPYKLAEEIILHALNHSYELSKIAVFVPTKFLSSQRRHVIFNSSMWKVIIFSRRPSVPPGTMLARYGESIRGGGSIDFCWCVWLNGYTGTPTISWSLG